MKFNQFISETKIAFIGFGEAAQALCRGWAENGIAPNLCAYDIKTESASDAVRYSKLADYQGFPTLKGCTDAASAVSGAHIVFSLVTADQALIAAENAAQSLTPEVLYLDCNSCSPQTKKQAARVIEKMGGHYVDVAVMAPVIPRLHRTPMLISGKFAALAHKSLTLLDMRPTGTGGDIGVAASVKMIRSILVKGMEALTAECLLAGDRAGVSEAVLDSLQSSFNTNTDWRQQTGYNLERMAKHGSRRAAEMREVSKTLDELGLYSDMTQASVQWQQRLADLKLSPISDDYRKMLPLVGHGLQNEIKVESDKGEVK